MSPSKQLIVLVASMISLTGCVPPDYSRSYKQDYSSSYSSSYSPSYTPSYSPSVPSSSSYGYVHPPHSDHGPKHDHAHPRAKLFLPPARPEPKPPVIAPHPHPHPAPAPAHPVAPPHLSPLSRIISSTPPRAVTPPPAPPPAPPRSVATPPRHDHSGGHRRSDCSKRAPCSDGQNGK